MLSRNLVKQVAMILPQDEEKRIIDSNPLVKKRLGALFPHDAESEGFVSGLAAETIEVEDGEANVIKANKEVDAIIEQAHAEAETILKEAQAEAIRIREQAKAQAEKEKTEIFAQARQQGYVEGTARAQAQVDALEQQHREKERILEAAYQEQLDGIEPQFIDAITGIYEHVFNVELDAYHDILVHLIATTLRKLEGSHSFVIHVSKEDYPYVSMQKKQMLAGAVSANCSVDVVEDMTLGRNECMIETEGGIYDCGLGTQLSELKRKLMLLAWSRES